MTPLQQVVGELMKQLAIADMRFDLGSLTPEPIRVSQGWKMAAAFLGSASAFQGGRREDKGQKSHTI